MYYFTVRKREDLPMLMQQVHARIAEWIEDDEDHKAHTDYSYPQPPELKLRFGVGFTLLEPLTTRVDPSIIHPADDNVPPPLGLAFREAAMMVNTELSPDVIASNLQRLVDEILPVHLFERAYPHPYARLCLIEVDPTILYNVQIDFTVVNKKYPFYRFLSMATDAEHLVEFSPRDSEEGTDPKTFFPPALRDVLELTFATAYHQGRSLAELMEDADRPMHGRFRHNDAEVLITPTSSKQHPPL